ncbi:MAG: hypothetical protein ACW98D_20500 [Promethearchaeota archaeon]|jgi:hypothetical protein
MISFNSKGAYMGINIDLVKIYEIIRDSGKPKKEDVIRCLSMIAWEAEELCSTWEKIIKLSVKKGKITKKEKDTLLKNNLFSHSAPLYGRIINFYRNMSVALGDKLDFGWIEKIYHLIGQVILHHKDIKESLEKFNKIKWSQSPLYLSTENNGKVIKDVASSLQILQNEVATLKSLPEKMNLAKIDELVHK